MNTNKSHLERGKLNWEIAFSRLAFRAMFLNNEWLMGESLDHCGQCRQHKTDGFIRKQAEQSSKQHCPMVCTSGPASRFLSWVSAWIHCWCEINHSLVRYFLQMSLSCTEKLSDMIVKAFTSEASYTSKLNYFVSPVCYINYFIWGQSSYILSSVEITQREEIVFNIFK